MKDTDLVRYSRHIMLPEIDIEGQKKISSSKISIVGLGGLGCSASSFLAASGVGKLNLIDDGFIDISNLHNMNSNFSSVNTTTRIIGNKKITRIEKTVQTPNGTQTTVEEKIEMI